MNNLKVILISVVGVLAVILMCVFGMQGVKNKAIVLEEQVNNAESDIRVQEKRRVDLIYNLVDCVKEYDKHEYETLKDTVEVRSDSEEGVQEAVANIQATAEAYPDLKSNENYKQLMNELSMTENLIAEYRSNYNKQIKNYNRYVRKFPNKQCLSMLGYEEMNYQYLDYDAPETSPQNLFEE